MMFNLWKKIHSLVAGTRIRSLVPNELLPSQAIFDDITLSPAGSYRIEVRGVMHRDVKVMAALPIVITKDLLHTTVDLLFFDYSPLFSF